MGRHGPYRPGSFYRVSDRTGFPTRAEETKKEWTGLLVEERVWEARQPQDLVRGVRDDQSVPEPRPVAPNTFVSALYFTLADDAPPQSYRVVLTYTIGISVGDSVGVILDDGSIFNTTVAGGDALLDTYGNQLFDTYGQPLYDTNGTIGPGIGLADPLPQNASAGNLMIDYRVTL
jgi:hypothetical protein